METTELKPVSEYLLEQDPVQRATALGEGMKQALEWVQEASKLRDIAILEAYSTSTNTSALAKSLNMSRGRLYGLLDRYGYEPKVHDWNDTVARNKRIREKLEELRKKYPMGEIA